MTDQPMGTWTRRLRWDEENRLLAVWPEGAGVPLDTWAFAYDHNGERVLKYRINAGAVAEAELYLRDEQGNVLTELDWVDTGAGGYWARAKDHVYLGRDLIGSLDYSDGTPHVVSYARDHLGTQRAEVWGLDTATTTDLWPYGEVASTKLLGDAPPLANGAHLFTGHERDFMGTEADPLKGLDYMHARYYSHQLGRFLSVDLVGSPTPTSSQSWNRFSFALGNPSILFDPNGEETRISYLIAGPPRDAAAHAMVRVWDDEDPSVDEVFSIYSGLFDNYAYGHIPQRHPSLEEVVAAYSQHHVPVYEYDLTLSKKEAERIAEGIQAIYEEATKYNLPGEDLKPFRTCVWVASRAIESGLSAWKRMLVPRVAKRLNSYVYLQTLRLRRIARKKARLWRSIRQGELKEWSVILAYQQRAEMFR